MSEWPTDLVSHDGTSYPTEAVCAEIRAAIDAAEPGTTHIENGPYTIREHDTQAGYWIVWQWIDNKPRDTGYYFAPGHPHPLCATWGRPAARCMGYCVVCGGEVLEPQP